MKLTLQLDNPPTWPVPVAHVINAGGGLAYLLQGATGVLATIVTLAIGASLGQLAAASTQQRRS
ncbi:hypothetical protein [Actinomadura bangladeshensis]|uniref:Holin n=1 Tax=Actinomadura bangladeshensis TaxID=453573 RepID=A0A4R4P4E0_9ACTN|nr:hypothetical protein [Actinomadura bangladeshensis]TDC17261.1 hypothetical protein E1284_09935 [Actinomadura bangladeshensis]